MRAYLPHLSRYQREVFDLGQSIGRATRCLSDLTEGASAKYARQQARLVLAALREHQQGVDARFAELEQMLQGDEK